MKEKNNIRHKLEKREHEFLSKYASFSDSTLGRKTYEEPCDIRPAYQRDRDRILHSKAFRRLKHKTQVFLAPEGDHYRTRLTHTLEVAQIARTIAKALRLNEELTEAIALGHDLGHTPFGHAGERALREVCPEGFEHHLQSIRIVDFIERNGKGLNLTIEVKDGIKNHKTSGKPSTLEGKIVRYCDKIAYINHDIDDAIRGKIIKEEDIPKKYTDILGRSVSERLNTFIYDIISNSEDKNDIIMSSEIEETMMDLRDYMFDNVYLNKEAKAQEEQAKNLIQALYIHYMKHLDLLPAEYLLRVEENNEEPYQAVIDYIAGMTDRFAVAKFKELMIPEAWSIV